MRKVFEMTCFSSVTVIPEKWLNFYEIVFFLWFIERGGLIASVQAASQPHGPECTCTIYHCYKKLDVMID